MLETKLNNVIFIPVRNIKTIEKEIFPPLFCGGRAKTEEHLRGGYVL